MPTANIACGDVKVATDAWSLVGGLTKPLAVELPDDDDISYIVSTGASTSQEFNLAAHSIPPDATINSVKIVRRHKRDGASNGLFSAMIFLGGSNSNAGSVVAGASYATTTSSALVRPGGGSWQVADLSGATIRVTNISANNTRVTTLYLLVDYTLAAAKPVARRAATVRATL